MKIAVAGIGYVSLSIVTLLSQHHEDELTIKAMQLVLEDFMTKQKEIDEKLAAMEVSQSGLED